MTELTTTRPQSTPRPVPTIDPALITEEQVRFGTAAARLAAPPTHGHWASTLGAVRGLWRSHRGPEHRHYPQRFAYLEHALLSRELDRL
ncbi:hypothetical protein [Mycobacterium sp. 852002-51961_SCH5331710]|uniref:hypothetical protein n=1 Tax=Mycobacterium sp. 852002-51961_SCH5331710 TaxID=1834105 RepID=UPI0007FBD815|nr:hypothetical protein [Mycobacterium sp. 852002-51961_SCH5331710]OBB42770.1 hypothetical protein A5752_06585 [Mycobacterium sp. 852002-51961_SCH5331710]